MASAPVTIAFFLDFETGRGFRVAQVGTGKSADLVIHKVEKAYTTDVWVVLRDLIQGHKAALADHHKQLLNEESGRWTQAVVSPDEAWTLRTVMPASGVPATVPYTIEKGN